MATNWISLVTAYLIITEVTPGVEVVVHFPLIFSTSLSL